MKNRNSNNAVDTRPVFDVREVPLLSRFKSARAMKNSAFKAAIPDLAIAAIYLYAMIMFLDIKPVFKSNMEGMIIVELIVLILFPLLFRILATEEKTKFRATRKLNFITSWINVFNVFFILAIMGELAYLTSIAEGRAWIPMQLVILSGSKVYSVFFTGDKKVKAKQFYAQMTARLVCGLFCGVFTYFVAAIPLSLIFSSQMLSEVCMLLVGYVYFIMMGICTLFKQDILYLLESQDKEFEETGEEMILEVCYPRLEEEKQ
jgi:hypothetical protein